MIIRRAVYTDAPLIIESHIRSIREVCAADYTAAQIAAWSGRNFQESIWHKSIDEDLVFVIADVKKYFWLRSPAFPI